MPLCGAPSMQPSDPAVHAAGIIPSQLGILSNINDGDNAALEPTPAGGDTANQRTEDSDYGQRMAVDTLIN